MAPTNRYWQLHAYPEGNAFEAAFRLEEEPMPEPGEGQLVIRNAWLSLDAGTRMWFSPRTDSYMPPLALGSKVTGFALGHVARSRNPAYREGDLVRAYGQWADHSLLDPGTTPIWPLPDIADPRHHFAALGPNGWAAYVGLTEYGRARPGETVAVSAAAGATGLLAAQFAKAMGCRVIGIAGGGEKAALLTGRFGLDAAIDYRRGDVAAALAEAAPGGIDVYFDNVGGPLLDAVLPNMALFGRVAVCGLIATYDEAERRGPAMFDLVLMKRLTIAGFFSPDFYHRGAEIDRLVRPWLEAGRIDMPFDVSDGLESVLSAYRKLFTGGNVGKVLVRLGA